MSYILSDDIELRMGTELLTRLTDDEATGAVVTAVVDEARLGAIGEVNSYLARRYRVPIDLVRHPELADLLRSVSLDVVEYRLHARKPPVPSDVLLRHRNALNWLSQAATGHVVLPSVAPIAANAATGQPAAIAGDTATFSRDELESL